jgi:serpin B
LSAAVLALLPAGIFAGEGKPQAELGPVVEGNTAFGVALFQQLRETEGNLFFSPYSISTALAMTYGGARGQTQKEMAEVLRFSLKLEEHNERFSALQSYIKAVQRKGSVRLSVANSLWGQRDYRFLDAFLTNTKTFYGAGLQTVDFARETEAARQAINAWAEKETEGKIKELLRPNVLTPAAVLVLCNAIYFKGNWAVQFDAKQTRVADFFVAVDKPTKAPMMNQRKDIRNGDFGDFGAIELPYKGGQLSMVVLLPKELDGLPSLERSLTARRLQDCLGILGVSPKSSVRVSLPKFRTTSCFDLGKTLVKMGMVAAFGRDADFSGMDGNRGLFISKVVHKAFVEVNEEGTEAAAATAVVMESESVPRVTVFNANHPFLFLIRENETGSILFLGRLADPTLTGE